MKEKYIFIDVETTGYLSKAPRDKTTKAVYKRADEVLSIGAVITDENAKVIDTFYGLSRPRPNSIWNYRAEKIHKFTEDQARSFPFPEETQNKMLEWLSPYNLMIFISHCSGSFDYDFFWGWIYETGLQFEFRKYINPDIQLNTLKISRDKLQLPSNTLDKVCEHFDIQFKHHNALEDAEACRKVFLKLEEGEYL